jgi:hypothetical protein
MAHEAESFCEDLVVQSACDALVICSHVCGGCERSQLWLLSCALKGHPFPPSHSPDSELLKKAKFENYRMGALLSFR